MLNRMNAIPDSHQLLERILTLFGGDRAEYAQVPSNDSPYVSAPNDESFKIRVAQRARLLSENGFAETWLATPNPTFGGNSPQSFVNGTDEQRAFLDSILSSFEDGAFS